jgi:hypothetical protein
MGLRQSGMCSETTLDGEDSGESRLSKLKVVWASQACLRWCGTRRGHQGNVVTPLLREPSKRARTLRGALQAGHPETKILRCVCGHYLGQPFLVQCETPVGGEGDHAGYLRFGRRRQLLLDVAGDAASKFVDMVQQSKQWHVKQIQLLNVSQQSCHVKRSHKTPAEALDKGRNENTQLVTVPNQSQAVDQVNPNSSTVE